MKKKVDTDATSEVLFASTRVRSLSARATLPAKFVRMLQRLDLARRFKDRSVAIKMHMGGGIGYSTVHPLFVRTLVAQIRAAGGRPFLTDGSEAVDDRDGLPRGYTEEVLGAPLRPAAGVGEKYFVRRRVGYRSLKEVEVCGEIANADAMVVLSHGKGHEDCGFGGAIKNIAMGCVTTRSRGDIHSIQEPDFAWDREKCTHCYICRDNCPGDAISFSAKGEFTLSFSRCRYCRHCVGSCPTHAITHSSAGWKYFQTGMAATTRAVLETFEPGRVLYVTALMQITPLCDCWGFTTPSLVPDIGIVASDDIVAVEQAALDLIDQAPYIEGSLPDQVNMGDGGHLFERIWGKDPYVQVERLAKNGIGSRDYRLLSVR